MARGSLVALVLTLLAPAVVHATCEKDADHQETRSVTSAPTPSVPEEPGFPTAVMKLEPEHVAQLRAAGAKLDAKEAAVADHMAARGFSPAEYVEAARAHRELMVKHPEVSGYPAQSVETTAIALRLALDPDDRFELLAQHHERGLKLTEAYNRQIVGGPGLVIAGWGLAGLGLGLVGSGAGFEEVASHGDTVSIAVTALAMVTTGTALVLASIPCLAVGYVRWHRWLPDTALDGDGPPRTRADSRRPGLSLVSISPVVTDRFAGMGATFQF